MIAIKYVHATEATRYMMMVQSMRANSMQVVLTPGSYREILGYDDVRVIDSSSGFQLRKPPRRAALGAMGSSGIMRRWPTTGPAIRGTMAIIPLIRHGRWDFP